MAPRKPAAPKGKGKTRNNRPPDHLTPRMKLFVQYYLVDLNATEAARKAGYSPRTAREQGNRLMMYPIIGEAIAAAMAARVERIQFDQDKVVKELLAIAFCDTNELVQYRRTCCRYCYGEFNRYQRTAGEMEADELAHEASLIKADAEGIKLTEKARTFDRQGGIGYDPRKDPFADCPECFGEGVGRSFVPDTRKLSEAGRSLYAGYKQTKDGFEVKLHDKAKFVELLMRHKGMLNDKLRIHDKPEDPLAKLLDEMQGSSLPISSALPDDDEED